MKFNHFSVQRIKKLWVICLLVPSAVAIAQTPKKPATQPANKPAAKPIQKPAVANPKVAKPSSTPNETSTSTYQGSGTMDITKVKSELKLNRLEEAKRQLESELEQIRIARQTSAKDPCLEEELSLRQRDAEFAIKYAAQMESIIQNIRKGLQRQRVLLRGFENGSAEGEEVQNYTNAEGQPDQSAMIEFYTNVDDGVRVYKKIALKDLIRYIRKFEAEAATVPNDAASVETFLDRYRNPETQNKAEYFYITLEQAIKAYTKLVGSVFAVTQQEMMQRKLVVGTGKNVFQVRTITTLGYDPIFGTHVGSTLQAAQAKKVKIELLHSFGEAFRIAEEDRYWEIIRSQQLTIDGIPIDGLKRREYFDSLRSKECTNKVKYNFNEKSQPGPFLSYQEKTECTNRGIEILSASVTTGVDGIDSIYDFTQTIREQANRKYHHTVDPTSLAIPTELLKQSTAIKIRYRCNCDRNSVQEAIKVASLNANPTRCGWGCGNGVNDHLVGWAYQEIASLLSRARSLYGQSVLLEILTVNHVAGYQPRSAIGTIHQVFGNRGGTGDQGSIRQNLDSLRMTQVSSLPPAAAPYRFDYRLILPGDAQNPAGRRIDVGRSSTELTCPQD